MKLKKVSKETGLDTEADSLKSQLARALADYDNLKKRTELEKQMWMKFSKQSILEKILSVLDTLESAQKHLNDQGLGMAVSQFKDVLTGEGVLELDELETFDENIHEAIDMSEGGEKGKIAEVVQKGYKFASGEVIRPAKVRVFKGI